MKKLIFLPAAYLLILLIQSCGSTKNINTAPVVHIIEKQRIIHAPFETIWQRTIELLATYNIPIKNLDKNSGFISTEFKLVTGDPTVYMYTPAATSNFMGKVEMVNQGGNLNVMVKKINNDSSLVTVNCFYSCVANKYRYQNILSSNYILESSTRVDCESTGTLEKAMLDYIAGKIN